MLIDLWQGKPAALNWLRQHQAVGFGLPVIARMELVNGARSSIDRERANAFLAPYPTVYLTYVDSVWAQRQHKQFKLSHNVGILDALIAAPAARLDVPIFTLNIKHFTILPGVTATRPY